MNRLVRHVRQNVVGYLALFVALGGTSYAAIAIPRNSVGANQLRNHSIQPVKLDGKYFGGYVRMWAQVSSIGTVVMSSPRGARTNNWNSTVGSGFTGGDVIWPEKIPQGCFAFASAIGFAPGAGPSAVSAEVNGPRSHQFVTVYDSPPTSLNVAVVCPA